MGLFLGIGCRILWAYNHSIRILQIWTFLAKYLSFSLLCAMLRTLLGICIVIDKTGCAMVILLPWCDFPLPDVTFVYRRCAMGMLWLLPAWCDLSTVFVHRERPANFARFSLRINHHGGGRFVNLAIVWLARLVCKQNIACHFVKI